MRLVCLEQAEQATCQQSQGTARMPDACGARRRHSIFPDNSSHKSPQHSVKLTLHANHRLVSVHADALLVEDLLDLGGDEAVELARERLAKHGVHDEALAAEVGVGANTLGTVDDLVGDHEMARGDLLAERADGTERDDGTHTEMLQSGNVRARRHLGRRDRVRRAVPGDERDLGAVRKGGNGNGRRGLAPRRLDLDLAHKG